MLSRSMTLNASDATQVQLNMNVNTCDSDNEIVSEFSVCYHSLSSLLHITLTLITNKYDDINIYHQHHHHIVDSSMTQKTRAAYSGKADIRRCSVISVGFFISFIRFGKIKRQLMRISISACRLSVVDLELLQNLSTVISH